MKESVLHKVVLYTPNIMFDKNLHQYERFFICCEEGSKTYLIVLSYILLVTALLEKFLYLDASEHSKMGFQILPLGSNINLDICMNIRITHFRPSSKF